MRKSMLAILVVLGVSSTAVAQEGSDGSAAGSGSAVVNNVDSGSGSGSHVAPSTPTEKSLIDQITEIKADYAAYKSSTPAGKDIALAGLIAVLVNLLLTAVKKVMTITDKGKKWLPWVATGLGIVIAILDKYAMGGGWVQAVIYGASGPGAVVIQELLALVKGSTPAAPTKNTATPTPVAS